jgi:hypothetical protein
VRAALAIKLFLLSGFCCVLVACGGGGIASSKLSGSSDSTSVSSQSISSSSVVSKGFQKPFILFSSKNIKTRLSLYTLATNDNGESILAWPDINQKYMTVIAGVKLYKDGGYSPVYHFSNPDHLASSFDVSINNQGDVNFVWIDEEDVDEAIEQIWSRNISGNGDVMPIARLDKLDFDPDIHGPESLIFDNGNVITVWSQNRRLYSSFYQKSEGWTEPEIIDENTGSSINPILGKDKYGNVTVAWRKVMPGTISLFNYVVATNYFVPGQGWMGVNYFKDSIKDFDNLSLDVNSSGTAILAWTEVGSAENVYSSFFVPGVGWDEIQKHSMGGFLSASGLTVDINNKGQVALVWKTNNNQLHIANYSPEKGWKETATFNAEVGEQIRIPLGLAIGESGRAMVSWSQGFYVSETYGNTVNLKLAEYDPVLGWREPKTISTTPTSGIYLNSKITLVEGEKIFVSWGEITDALEERIWISRYFE